MTPSLPALTTRRISGRVAAFLRRPGPRGGDGLLALVATVLSLYVLYEIAPDGPDGPRVVTDINGTPFMVIPPDEEPGTWPTLLCAVTTAALAWRRSRPAVAFGVQVCAMLPATDNDPTVIGIVAVALGAYSVAAHITRLAVAATVFGAATVALVARFPDDANGGPPGTIVLAVMTTTWITGRTIGTWRTRAGAFHGRALRAERAREEAVARERARIARELHDVVSHNVSVMVIQSGAARMVLRTDPDSAVEALLAVETSGRETMAELRYLLGVLTTPDSDAAPKAPADTGRGDRTGPTGEATSPASPDGDALGPPLAPQPDLTRLPVLVDRVRAAGLDVRLDTCGDTRPLPPGVELTAYRVVQEALTNALKYAPGARTEVTMTYRPDTVHIEVADNGPAPGRRPEPLGAGRGLLGLTERVALHGGRLDAGPRPTGGYRVRATIPVPAP